MAKKKLTKRQESDVASLRVLLAMDQDELIDGSETETIADALILTKNAIWKRGGNEEVKLLVSIAEEDLADGAA